MKKLVIGLFVLGLTGLGFSQNKNGEVKEVKLKDVVITNVNFSYLEKVQDNTTVASVKTLETEASMYNVKESAKFDGHNEPFKVIFRGDHKSYIIAIYDNNGKILETTERYNNIIIPKNVIKSVLSQYPNSSFLKMVHTVNYNHEKDVKKIYRIKIMNDNLTKNLRITTNGSDDNSYAMTLEN